MRQTRPGSDRNNIKLYLFPFHPESLLFFVLDNEQTGDAMPSDRGLLRMAKLSRQFTTNACAIVSQRVVGFAHTQLMEVKGSRLYDPRVSRICSR